MDVTIGNDPLVNWESYQQARTELGANFVRILGYFREDGIKSVDRIEDAMRGHNATARSRAKRASSAPIRWPISPRRSR
jgi:hypothetical protein